MMPTFNKLTIIGLGLIGSSVARAARAAKVATTIVGVDRDELALHYATKHGFIDRATDNAAEAVRESDVVVIATPTHLLAEICDEIAPNLKPGTLVMDTGSVKMAPLSIMTEYLPAHLLVVPAHPIAGSEQSGVTAGRADLLDKKRVIITPQAPLTHEQFQQVSQFWQALGARVEAMPAALHDTIYGYVSHLPQLLAFAVAPLIVDADDDTLPSVFKRFTRLCHSDPQLWTGIFILNANVLLPAINRYLDALSHIRRELVSVTDTTTSCDDGLVRQRLFPRVVASCLATTVMEAERREGIGFIRFAGTGFADFSAPVASDPESELEQISSANLAVAAYLGDLDNRLKLIAQALHEADAVTLLQRLQG